MQIVREDISAKDGSGTVKLMVELTDDLWHLYNLIDIGDSVRTTTERKVHKELGSGASSATRIKLNLTVVVEKSDFDAEAAELRLSGRNVEENDHVKLGAFHTLELQLHRSVTLTKQRWDAVALERLHEASDRTRDAEVAVLVLQPGVAHLCLITPSLTLTRAKIVVPLPRKGRRGDGAHARAVDKFHEAMLQAILRHVDFGVVKALVVGSPGFAADELLAYVWAQAQRREDARALLPHRAKVVRCHASSGFKHSVRDVLSDPATAAQLASTRAAAEVAALDAFVAMLGRDLGRAVYGFAHVRAACDHGALETLLISDELFRAQAVGARLRYVALVEEAKAAGAVVHIFSAMHISGEQLAKLSGVAATLRFPLADELLDETAAASGEGAGAAFAAAFAAGEAALDAAGGDILSSDDDGEGPLALPADGIFDGAAYDPFR